MTLPNLTAFTPQLAYAVCEALHQLGGEESLARLRQWLSPERIYPADARPQTVGQGLGDTLTFCELAGLVSVQDDRVHLQIDMSDLDGFRWSLLDRLVHPSMNEELFNESPSNGIRSHELTRALTWFCQLDPTMGPFGTGTSNNFERLLPAGPLRLVQNNTRWNVFDRWSVFLGFAWRLKDNLIPDPTRALLHVLDELLPPGNTVAFPAFMAAMAKRLPVLDGGAYHQGYVEAFQVPWDARVVSPALTLALMRLEKKGELVLKTVSDAESRTLRLGSGVERSHNFVSRPSTKDESHV